METGRRGFLKGLAALTGSALAGKYVVQDPQVVNAGDIEIRASGLVLPQAPQLVIARDVSPEVTSADIIADKWSLDLDREHLARGYHLSRWADLTPDWVHGRIRVEGPIIGDMQALQSLGNSMGAKVRVYFEIVDDA